jgi:hypothetical protein
MDCDHLTLDYFLSQNSVTIDLPVIYQKYLHRLSQNAGYQLKKPRKLMPHFTTSSISITYIFIALTEWGGPSTYNIYECLFFLVNLSNNVNCTCIYVLYDFWLIPHPAVIWLTYGSTECNIYVCMSASICEVLISNAFIYFSYRICPHLQSLIIQNSICISNNLYVNATSSRITYFFSSKLAVY